MNEIISKDDQSMEPGQFIKQALAASLPVETLERLLALRKDLKTEKDKELFFSALARFQKRIPSIEKKNKVDTGNYIYSYADMATIQEAVYPILAENDLSVTFECELTGNIMIVSCIVHHQSGHSEKTEFKLPVDTGMKMNNIQKTGAAFTYGRRYALLGALGIATAEEDTDASDSTFISEDQHKRLEAIISESKVPRERIRHWVENRHGVHYPDGVHFNALYTGHAKEIEKYIPWFQEKIKQECIQSLWSGDIDNLKEIVTSAFNPADGLLRIKIEPQNEFNNVME